MMNEVTHDTLYRQGKMSGEDYFNAAASHIEEMVVKKSVDGEVGIKDNIQISDILRLAEIMQREYLGTVRSRDYENRTAAWSHNEKL